MKLTRRLTSFGLKLLPRRLRYAAIRRGFNLKEGELAEVESVHIASTTEEYLEAMKLVHDGYVSRGIITPHQSRIRMTHYLALPSSMVFVARTSDGRVAGTLSLIKDSPLGLPMEKIYGDEVQTLRAQGRVTAEVGALCVAADKRGSGIAFLLYKAMFLTAARLLGVDDLVIAVHPDAADLYIANLQFERIGPVRQYPKLERSACAVAMRLNLNDLGARYAAAWGQLPNTAANPHWLYFERHDPQISLPPDAARLSDLRPSHRRATMKLAALRPDIVLDLEAHEFDAFRHEMADSTVRDRPTPVGSRLRSVGEATHRWQSQAILAPT